MQSAAPARRQPRLCALSIDLDEVRHYHAIHGLVAPPTAEHAVFDRALPRYRQLARELSIPLTLFTVASDLARPENGEILRGFAMEAHEIANHSLDHFYDLTRRSRDVMVEQITRASDKLEEHTGQRPVGFRAPGYVVNDALYDALERCGTRYSSSVFPCPPYYLAKLAAITLGSLRGRRSSSLIDTPRVLSAPRRPYRVGTPYWRRGNGILELPIQVTPWLRLPFIGTSLTLAGPRVSRWLARSLVGEPLINLELHGVDLLDEHDGLEALAPLQLDLRVPVARKYETLRVVVETLRAAGYEFVTLREAADTLE
jgi:peptidoglycan/xylan/chitin deacetylase (PgdA/CDA1 family)